MSVALYNEIDGYAAAWLRNLSAGGQIAAGDVDARSIKELRPEDCHATQCHFFAGIGGWSYALRLAGWPDDFPVWTGSCPCQPFSVAGAKRGFSDERHLWPEWLRLIRECRPATIFGEQVGGPGGLKWLDSVFADLEGIGYACGAANLPASGVGAPHIRQRLFFVAHRLEVGRGSRGHTSGPAKEWRRRETNRRCPTCIAANATRGGFGIDGGTSGEAGHASQREPACNLADADGVGFEWKNSPQPEERAADSILAGASAVSGFWADAEWIPCSDGKARPVKPGLECLVNGIPGRLADGRAVKGWRAGMIRGFGNAIVLQAAAAFIRADIAITTDPTP